MSGLAIVGLAMGADCGGGSSTSPVVCNGAALPAPPTVLYPVNGSTVEDGSFTLVLAYAAGSSISIGPSGGTALTLSTASVPSPLPTPNATPEPNETPAGYAVPALSAHTTYDVTANYQPGTVCASTQAVGSFTTQ